MFNLSEIQFVVPATPEEFDAARHIFEEYAAQLDVDLCFQNFDAELAKLAWRIHCTTRDFVAGQGG